LTNSEIISEKTLFKNPVLSY